MTSFYDNLVPDGQEAPFEPTTNRTLGQHANRRDNTKPYVGRDEALKRAREAPTGERKDNSYYGYWRLFKKAQPLDEFEQSVNIAFANVSHDSFIDGREKYKELYKSMMYVD